MNQASEVEIVQNAEKVENAQKSTSELNQASEPQNSENFQNAQSELKNPQKAKNGIFFSIFKTHSRLCLIFVLFLLFVLLFANSSKWYFRKDFSRDKLYTLSPFTKELLDSLGESV